MQHTEVQVLFFVFRNVTKTTKTYRHNLFSFDKHKQKLKIGIEMKLQLNKLIKSVAEEDLLRGLAIIEFRQSLETIPRITAAASWDRNTYHRDGDSFLWPSPSRDIQQIDRTE